MEVKVLKSTGVKILDDAAACAFMQWKAKPTVSMALLFPCRLSRGTDRWAVISSRS